MDLGRRALPAHIAHVRGARREILPAVVREQEVVHRVPRCRPHPLYLLGDGGIGRRTLSGQLIASRVCPGEGVREGVFLRRVGRYAEGPEVFVEHLFQRMVRHRVRKPVDEFPLHPGAGHQGRSLGDLIHALLQADRLGHVGRTHHVEDGGLRLHHVRADAAGVGDRVVDPRPVAHMLPQELHADIHQLDRVQGAPAPVRVGAGVGRDSVELILHLDAGIGGARIHLAAVLRMPGERRVQALPEPVPGHEGLGRAPLFPGAAKEDDRAGKVSRLKGCLHADGPCQRAGAQQVVPAAVSVSAGHCRVVADGPALLGKPREGVILRQNADHRPAAAEGGRKRGIDTGSPPLHAKALFLQDPAVAVGRLKLLERKLRVFPDPVRNRADQLFLFFDRGKRRLFSCLHSSILLSGRFCLRGFTPRTFP